MKPAPLLLAALVFCSAVRSGDDERVEPARYLFDIERRNGTAFLGRRDGLVTLDLTDPLAPSELARLNLGAAIHDVVLTGERGLLAAGARGLLLVDLADPAAPALVASFDTPGSVRRVLVSGSHVFLADDGEGLRVVDLSEPTNPRVIVPQARPLKIRFP